MNEIILKPIRLNSPFAENFFSPFQHTGRYIVHLNGEELGTFEGSQADILKEILNAHLKEINTKNKDENMTIQTKLKETHKHDTPTENPTLFSDIEFPTIQETQKLVEMFKEKQDSKNLKKVEEIIKSSINLITQKAKNGKTSCSIYRTDRKDIPNDDEESFIIKKLTAFFKQKGYQVKTEPRTEDGYTGIFYEVVVSWE